MLIGPTNNSNYLFDDADSDGNVPLWEAMLGKHKHVIKLLRDNGADINFGDVGHFACTAAEQNNLDLLEDIVRYGGVVTLPQKDGSTALHVAVSEDNVDIVRFLLKQGADIDKPGNHGWTPRDLADQQGHEEIKYIFQSTGHAKTQSVTTIPEQQQDGIHYLGRFTSEPAIRPLSQQGSFRVADGSWTQNQPRRQTNNFHNSLFGMMSAAHTVEKDLLFSVGRPKSSKQLDINPTRVIISCPEKGEAAGKLVRLPDTFQELLELGAKKFGISHAKVLSKQGADIDDIEVIRDDDHLIFVSEGGQNCLSNGSL